MNISAETLLGWIDIASKDLSSAIKLATPPEPQWETAVYHCQQAAEKATKALLILHGQTPPKLHDIGLLVDKLEQFDHHLSDLTIAAERLTDFATKYRYPSFDDDPLTHEVVNQAIADAGLFLERAKTLVKEHIQKIASDGEKS